MNPRPSDPRDDNGATDDALRRLLGEAVSDVRPADRLGEIRRRTQRRTRRGRRWLPVVAGAGVATAAVVGGVVLLGRLGSDDPGPAAGPATSPDTHAAAIYFVGDTALGPRLFREFQSVPRADEEATLALALDRVEPSGGPADPDYRTVWPEASFAGARVDEDGVTIELAADEALRRPAGVSNREAWIGIQQVVYTAGASVGQALPVAFEYDDAPAEQVLGIEVGRLVERDRQHDVVSPVNISDPDEGAIVEGEVLRARGTRTDTNGRLSWKVVSANDPYEEGLGVGGLATPFSPGADDEADALAWSIVVDLATLGPGDYVFSVHTRTTGQTSDSPARFVDTRTFTVR